jgi:hypothetical protein
MLTVLLKELLSRLSAIPASCPQALFQVFRSTAPTRLVSKGPPSKKEKGKTCQGKFAGGAWLLALALALGSWFGLLALSSGSWLVSLGSGLWLLAGPSSPRPRHPRRARRARCPSRPGHPSRPSRPSLLGRPSRPSRPRRLRRPGRPSRPGRRTVGGRSADGRRTVGDCRVDPVLVALAWASQCSFVRPGAWTPSLACRTLACLVPVLPGRLQFLCVLLPAALVGVDFEKHFLVSFHKPLWRGVSVNFQDKLVTPRQK